MYILYYTVYLFYTLGTDKKYRAIGVIYIDESTTKYFIKMQKTCSSNIHVQYFQTCDTNTREAMK